MAAGTAEILAALGNEASKVTTKQIQEALCHYYYDVDKSIMYLMNKFIAPPSKATKNAAKNQKGGQYSFSILRPTDTMGRGGQGGTSDYLARC